MNRLKKEFLNLGLGEFAALCTFIFVRRLFDLGQASNIAFYYLIFILFQGSMYWFYRYLLIVKKERIHSIVVKLFRFSKGLNFILLITIGIMLFYYKTSIKDLIIGIGLYLFGIIEYVNYYFYRLSYGKSGFNLKKLWNTGLKKSSLHKMLDKNKESKDK